jgi:hypothetical protein
MRFQLKKTSKHFTGSRPDESFLCVTFYKAKKSDDSDEVSRRKLLDEARQFLIGELVSPPLTLYYQVRQNISFHELVGTNHVHDLNFDERLPRKPQSRRSESSTHGEELFQLSNNEKECVERRKRSVT